MLKYWFASSLLRYDDTIRCTPWINKWPKIHGLPGETPADASRGWQHKGEVRKAEAMFRAMLEWRHSFGVDVPSLETEDENGGFGQNNFALISQHSWFRFWKGFFSLLQLWAALELSQVGMFKLGCRESPWVKEKVSSWRRELEQQRTQRSIQMSLAWGIFVKCDWYLRCI